MRGHDPKLDYAVSGCSCENVKDMIDSKGITKSSILKMTQRTRFGIYGRQFVSETLVPAIEEFATGDFGAGKGNSVVIRFEA